MFPDMYIYGVFTMVPWLCQELKMHSLLHTWPRATACGALGEVLMQEEDNKTQDTLGILLLFWVFMSRGFL